MKNEVTPTQKMLNTWAIVVILWSAYRYYFQTDLPIWFDEFIAKPIIFLIPIYYFITKYEKVNFWKAIDFKIKKPNDVMLGILAGMFVLVMGMVVYYDRTGSFLPSYDSSVFLFVGVAFATSFSEEILSRGFVLKRLYEESKNVITSVFFASFLFFVLHIPILFSNPAISGPLLLQIMLTDFLVSFGVSLAYLQRKNVVVAIIIHALYNLGIYLIL